METRSISSTPRMDSVSAPTVAKAPVAVQTPVAKVQDGFAAAKASSAPVNLRPATPFVPVRSNASAVPTASRVEPLENDSAAAKQAAAATQAAASQHLPVLGPQTTLQIHSATRDELGMTHVRMSRLHNGLPVFGEQAIGHVGADGKVASVTGLVGEIPANLGKGTPAITAAQAAQRIERAFGLPAGTIPASEMTRMITQGIDGKYRDAWQIEGFFANLNGHAGALVDAEDGKMLGNWLDQGVIDKGSMERAKKTVEEAEARGVDLSKRPDSNGPSRATGNDNSLYSGKVEIGGTDVGGGKQKMLDSTRGQGIETNDAQGRGRDAPNPVDLIDNNGAWGETTDPRGTRTAIDAQFGAQMTSDFLRDVFGRSSIDGKGEKLLSTVNVRLEDGQGNLAPNAFWNGTQMTYGMGDGRMFSDLTTVDIAGHEIGHGLTERTAGLIYRNESGGLNESMSDIIGLGVEWYASKNNPGVQFNWQIGEDAFTPGVEGDALRYMDDPSRDRYSIDHYSKMNQYQPEDGIGAPGNNDNGGVHGSSGIMNNAFYLLANGGKNKTSGEGVEKGLGMEDSLKIYGRALQFYMTPNSTFAHARESVVQAATDLFGANSPEVEKVKQSWSAVGVE